MITNKTSNHHPSCDGFNVQQQEYGRVNLDSYTIFAAVSS
jgi:hypothetical protein